jgi:hypothetical protein
MPEHVPIEVAELKDGSFVVRLATSGEVRRYATVAEVWAALDVVDDPRAPQAALAA